MGKKSAPKPPDPQDVAAAQTGTNVSTAVTNAYLNNVNQVTPYGSLSYDTTGSYSWTDPSTGTTYDLPTFTATQTLSREQQTLLNSTTRAEQNMADLAANQSAKLDTYLSDPISAEGLPDRPGVPGFYGYSNFAGFDQLDPRYAEGGDITKSYNGDFSEDRLRVEQALMERMQPYLDRDQDSIRSGLANQGLMMGSEGYQRGIDDYSRQVNDARLGVISSAGEEQARMVAMERDRALFENQAQQQGYGQDRTNIDASNQTLQQMYENYMRATSANNQLQDARFNQDAARFGMSSDSRSAAMGELFGFRNQPINEITALLSGSQVTQPSFINPNQYNIPTTDYAGISATGYQQQVSEWNNNQQFGRDMMGGLFGLGSAALMAPVAGSDRRRKKDIRRVGMTDNGLPLYMFRYIGEPPDASLRLGVMADEVEKVRPEAVFEMPDGFKAVDYAKALGAH